MDEIWRMAVMGEMGESFGSVKREVAFSYDNPKLGYPRQPISTQKGLKEQLEQKIPTQIHFQSLRTESVYSEQIQCKLLELVFDIDVTDFNRYCLCVKQTNTKRACHSCWQHVEGASLVLEYLLKQHWGVCEENILWVLSGMKGFHCVVNDQRFLRLTRKERTVLFLQLQINTDKQLIQFASSLRPEFSLIIEEQFYNKSVVQRGLLSSDTFQQSCLALIKTEYYKISNALNVKWFNLRSANSEEKWKALLELERGQFPGKPLPSLVIALQCYYPKIDKGPFCEKHHIFKLPFSVHNSTRKIALPVQREALLSPDLPEGIPSLADANAYYREHAQILPTLSKGKEILKKWVDAY